MTEVLSGLFLGGLEDARGFPGNVLCVMNAWPLDGHPEAVWIPVVAAPTTRLLGPEAGPPARLFALPQQLDLAATVMDRFVSRLTPLLVHCRYGLERSPLAVAWFLRHRLGWSWDEAYGLLRRKRPEIQDRRDWLPEVARA